MLFSRGVWSVFGIRSTSLDAFRVSLGDKNKLAAVSQLVATARTKFGGVPSCGINPYASPRMDEGLAITDDLLRLSQQIAKEEIDADSWVAYYGSNEQQYSLGNNQYGFWLAINEFEDVTDIKSKEEALAYKEASKPFKFLSKDEKKVIEANVIASAVLSRKQFPVLVDFNSQNVYVASGNADEVGMVRSIIGLLGGEDYSLAWQFDTPEWPSRFLATVNDKNKFEADMQTRAEELTRFRPEEVEKLDDRMLEGIISTYFAMSELETGLWCGLKAPARIRLFKPSEPVSVSNPSVAFSVLSQFDKAAVSAASVMFQNLDSRFDRKGTEKLYRTDLFTIDVNDNVNLTDAGAAMLRGFDIPTFKREMRRAAKGRDSGLSIGEYWGSWLNEMKTAVLTFCDNVTETLKIDKKKYGLKPYEGESQPEVEVNRKSA
jgi:hypothetical protein